MKKRTSKLTILIMGLLVLLVSSWAFAENEDPMDKLTPKTVEVRLALRDLWVGHIFWVRNVVLMTKSGDKEGAKAAEEQVVSNAKSIAGAIAPFYGKDASDKLFSLLAGHYGAVKEYMNAEFAGKKKAMDSARENLMKNAEEIATFLSSANPNWPKDALLSALTAHAGHHMSQIADVKVKRWSSEAKTWEAMKNHIYMIADVLADGLAKQFPDKF